MKNRQNMIKSKDKKTRRQEKNGKRPKRKTEEDYIKGKENTAIKKIFIYSKKTAGHTKYKEKRR